MGKSNFNGGFNNGVLIKQLPVAPVHGKIYYVGNNPILGLDEHGASNNNNGSFNKPWATMTYAATIMKAGDVCYVRPGYTQTISGAAGIAMSTAGISFIGMGQGANRPTLTFSATASTITMSGASSRLENFVLVPSINAVVSAIVVSAADCYIDIETRDTSSSVEFVAGVLTTAAADRLNLRAKHVGFLAGSAGVSYIKLIGVNTGYIDVDYYGKSSTAVVEMLTTACDNIRVTGNFNCGTTSLTKNVVDTIGTSKWFADGYDYVAGARFTGGSGSALAATSGATTTAALGTDGTTVTDSATTVLGAVGANNADNAFSSSSVVSNEDGSVLERLETIRTFTGKGSGTAIAANKSLIDALGSDGTTLTDSTGGLYGQFLSLPRCVASAAKTLTTGTVTMFTITGGPIKVLEIVGIVTTVLQSQTTSTKLQVTTTTPSATVDMSAAAVDLTGLAAGTSIRHINTTAILTPVTAGFVMEGNAFATNDTQFLIPIGSIIINNASSSNTGAITWYLRYVPLAPLSRVA